MKVNLILSCLNVLAVVAFAQQPAQFDFIPTNLSGTFYGQVQIDGTPASAEDWIAAFDETGVCAGASQLIINEGFAYTNLVIYGDDVLSPKIDEGINPLESFTLILYDYSTNSFLDYPNSDAIFSFTEWTNTNGTPIPAYNDPNIVYNFAAASVVFQQSIQVCENALPVSLTGGLPEGGVYTGEGVVGSTFFPNLAGVGLHNITYEYEGELASITAEIFQVPLVEILFNDNVNHLYTEVNGGIEPYSYQWNTNDITSFTEVDASGNYWVIVNDLNCLSDTTFYTYSHQSISNQDISVPNLNKIVNLLGNTVLRKKTGVYLYIYDDGSVVKHGLFYY